MSAATQAATQTAHATWALFGATAALVIITGLAVLFGKRAADSATKTYRLEAEPVLVITQSWSDNIAEDLYVIAGNPALVNGLVLREKQTGDLPGPRFPGFASTGPTMVTSEQTIPWKHLSLAIHNAGRSPAVQVEVDVEVTCGALQTPGTTMVGFEADADAGPSDELASSGWISGIQRGSGVIRLPAIAPQSTVSVRIENYLGTDVQLHPRPQGRQVDWLDDRRAHRTIAVVVADAPYRINANI